MPRRTLVDRIAHKMHPSRFRVSGFFHAILACLLGQEGWTTPELAAVTATSDGWLLGMRKGDIGFNDFLGASVEELKRNMQGAAEAARLTKAETKKLLSLCPNHSLEAVS
jgi:hypothetical protein